MSVVETDGDRLMDSTDWYGAIFDGAWRRAAGGDIAVREPATGEELARVGLATPDDVRRSAERAAAAQREWAATGHEERAAVLRRAADLWAQHASEFESIIVRETGGVPLKARAETTMASHECLESAALSSRPYGSLLPSSRAGLSMARRLPVGVVAVITPFNFPLGLGIRSVAPALALGNAVLLKPDLRTAVTGGVLFAHVFEEAGLPEGLLHVLPGGADVGQALIAAAQVRVISFTGSTEAGRKVGEAAARHFKRAHLELGGNNALVVLGDADLERSVNAAAFGAFRHQGQICMTVGRHIVASEIADEFVGRLAEKAAGLSVGNPNTDRVELGPMIDEGQRDRVHGLVTASVDAGATLATGGEYDRLFYRPTVLDRVGPDSPVYASEVFGPVAPVIRFSSLDEAAALAGDTEYGLSLGILTRDVMAGLELANRIPSGMVHINDQTIGDDPVAPFGGVGSSGSGSRFGGDWNIEAFTDTQWVTVNNEIPRYP